MSESTTPDLSKIVGLIMENPRLIEEIATLAKKDNAIETNDAIESPSQEEILQNQSEERTVLTTKVDNHRAKNRTELLSAFKPYLSTNRAKAIDSMISIANVLDAMRR